METCSKCLMCADGRCCDPDSDWFRGPCPDCACALFETFEQICFDGSTVFWADVFS